MLSKSFALCLIFIGLTGTATTLAGPAIIAEFTSDITREGAEGTAVTKHSAWTFERGEGFVVVRNPERGVEERWVRDRQQRVWYTRIFHKERRVLEYAPTDLKLIGSVSNWRQLASIIDPEVLTTLQEYPSQSTDTVPGVTYRGKHAGQTVELRWLTREQLPAYIRKEDRHGVQTMHLVAMRDVEPDQSKTPSSVYPGYDILDFSDIGDRHHDPFVEQLVKYDGIFVGH